MATRCVPVTLGASRSRSVNVGGFLVTRVWFPPLLKLPLHTHDRATVAVILRGSFDGLMRTTSHPCPVATLLTEADAAPARPPPAMTAATAEAAMILANFDIEDS